MLIATTSSIDGTELDELELVRSMIARDEQAWRKFHDRYDGLISRCITKVTSRFRSCIASEDVREIHACVLASLIANDMRKLRSFDPARGTRLGSWIGMLASHATYDHLRSVRREPRHSPLVEAERLGSEQPSPLDTIERHERVRTVRAMLQRFSDKDRQFVALYFDEGLAPERIAEMMSISVKTVYTKRHKIQQRLEQLLAA